MAPFVLRDGTTVEVAPRDYSFYEFRDDRVWCSLCEELIPRPTRPVGAGVFDRQTSMMKHSITYHIERRVSE